MAVGLAIATIAIACAMAGCSHNDDIKTYTVAKEQDVNPSAARPDMPTKESASKAAAVVSHEKNSDRMLAAIVPHGENAWTFKLTGPVAVVGGLIDQFESFLQSVSFPASAGGRPKWTLPKDWQEAAGGGAMRYATISIPNPGAGGKPLEISVVPVPWVADGKEDERLLLNVNRWRNQMELEPIAAANLGDAIKRIQLAEGTASMVDLTGTFQSGGMQAPFASGSSRGSGPNSQSLPPNHPPVNANSSNSSPKANAGSKQAAAPVELPFTFKTPADWSPAPLPQFAAAAFTAKAEAEAKPVDISITQMAGRGGDLLMNINRWRTMQLALPAIGADELPTNAKPSEIGGKPGYLLHLVGSEEIHPQQAISAAMVESDGGTWVIKMKGDVDSIAKQQANFDTFVGSIHFGSSEK
ncbi:MAG TPA: hypothetical protein VGJ15_11980 [Pirellulales bacterium]|jgi:hypothetical protein